MLGLPYDIECTEWEGFSFRNTHTLHPQIFSQLRSYSADRFMYIVLIILFALCDNEAAWEHFWKKQLFKTALAGSFPKGTVLQGWASSSVHPTVVPQVLPGASCSMDPPWTTAWISSSPWSSVGFRGTACFTMVFSTACRGMCSGTRCTSSFFTDISVYRLVSLTFFSHFSHTAPTQHF